ncbi:MAG TPA: hypothetical protein ENL20_08880 [Candidatus Cloacimonetes bacterium]|nr:hypothetical protein [Candidatus Cloacimonadota bacterium]
MIKIFNILLFLLVFLNPLFSNENDLTSFLENILQNDLDLQKKENRLKTLIARDKIERSINWFDINFAYRKTSNELTRDQTEKQNEDQKLEHSDIKEEGERWWIELNRTFFEKDFDSVYDLLNAKLDITLGKFELDIFRIERSADIFSDFLEWKRADLVLEISHEKLKLQYKENMILERLFENNVIEPDDLIENLAEIKKIEKEISQQKEVISQFNKTYKNLNVEFYEKLELFSQIGDNKADTTAFKEKISASLSALNSMQKKILSSLRRKYYYFYLPEINLSLSYQKKNIFQDWEIMEDEEFKLRERDFKELYPEAEVELSVPFNFWGNTSGKYHLIKSLERGVLTKFAEAEKELQQFENKLINDFITALKDFSWQEKIFELQKIKFERIKKKYEAKPSLLGKNPEIAYKKEEFKYKKAELDFEISQMKLYKEIFLINYFAEK